MKLIWKKFMKELFKCEADYLITQQAQNELYNVHINKLEQKDSWAEKTSIKNQKHLKKTETVLTSSIIQNVLKQDYMLWRKKEHAHISANSHSIKLKSVKQTKHEAQSFRQITRSKKHLRNFNNSLFNKKTQKKWVTHSN